MSSSRGTALFSSFRSSQRSAPLSVSDEELIFSQASSSAAKFYGNSNAENTARLDESLVELIRYISNIEKAARLSLNNRHIKELLGYTPYILQASTTSANTRSRFYRLLFNIAHYNVPIRRYMACDLELCGPIFHCLKISLREELGPQNLIDILRVIQVLTYEKTVALASWTNELISFLISEVNREPEAEWLPYCVAILCNLATRSKSACNRIKKSSTYKTFCKRTKDLLLHDSRIIVVSCLVLIGYLEEVLRDMVYCPQNVEQTFKCVFNVLIQGDDDCLMTRQIAADLLRRLIVSDTPSISSVPTLATTGKDILNYGYFTNFIQETANLLVILNPRLEEATKIYDLFLSFCSLQILRPHVCQAIIRCQPSEARLTTPILAVLNAARMSSYEAINGEVPLKALKLLAYLLSEIVEPNEKIVPHIPIELIVELVRECVSTEIDLKKDNVDICCRRSQLGLRLAEVCARDEDIRSHLLEICSARLCSNIANYQFHQNPVVMYLTKPPLQRTETLESWSMSGISIVLELCRLLAVLKDHSRMHKEQYWQLLKDERLIPFLAYAISYGDHETVLYAFKTYSHCAQVHAFQTHLLAEMVASCTLERRNPLNGITASSKTTPCSSQEEKYSGERLSHPRAEHDERSVKALDELLRKVSIEGCNLKDTKTSELFAAFERKIELLQARERDLESLVRAKDEALAQSEKLRIQYKNGVGAANFGSDLEISKVRSVMQECEELRDQNQKLSAFLETAKHDNEVKLQALRDELRRSTLECERLRVENQSNQKLVDSYTISCDELKKKLETASASVFEHQQRSNLFEREKSDLAAQLQVVKCEADRVIKTNEAEIHNLNSKIAQQAANIEAFSHENKDIRRQFDEKLLECETVKEQLAMLENQYNSKDKELASVRQQMLNIEQRLVAKEREYNAAVKEISLYEEKLSLKEREGADRLAEIRMLKQDLENRTKELTKLEKLRVAMLSLAANSTD
ncbi:unnamed protein product [Caenorhabditis bovis]|uniref:CIP2A N-terminal domain-containing protein n=1 Tax=Caenorhabditis bovis TaxID=2654633 RepID=A0A8S1EXD9_9PELO|nr:unnamed protein product [Caenorhabditis bovis]